MRQEFDTAFRPLESNAACRDKAGRAFEDAWSGHADHDPGPLRAQGLLDTLPSDRLLNARIAGQNAVVTVQLAAPLPFASQLTPGTLAYWLWHKVLQSLDVSEAASFSFLVPLIGVSAGAAFFGETIGGNVALGAMLAALGLYLASSRNPRTSPLPGRRDH